MSRKLLSPVSSQHGGGGSRNKHRKLLFWSLVAVLLMFGFGFALVPLYNVLCKATGLNGKTDLQKMAENQKQARFVDTSRWVTVEFVTTNNAFLPWLFYPMQPKLRVHPGELVKIEYYASNQSGRNMTIQAIPSITPGIAAKFFKKTECFCFNQQSLAARHSMQMPVVFFIDNALPKNISTVTLSYTLFDRTKEAEQRS